MSAKVKNSLPDGRVPASSGHRRDVIRMAVFMSLVIVAFFALAGRCFYLQSTLADHYMQKSLMQQRAYLPLEPQRGAILDSRGRLLAASHQFRTIFAEPRIIKEPKETASHLAKILGLPAHEICARIVESNNPGYAVLKTDASVAECEAARKVHGIGIQYHWRRRYPTDRLASHVVGFTSTDNIGLAGIEHAFDRDLRGRGARQSFFVDVHRRPLAFCLADGEQNPGATGPTHGSGLILTLDATIQQFTREALLNRYREFEAESAIAVVADPRSGEILAMVSLPDFDPHEIGRTDPERFTNRVLVDTYEPGSILKPIIAAIALDMKVVNRYETIFCENGHYRGKYRGKSFGRITEYRQGFGDLTVREILMNSSNIGMAKIGQRLGPERLYEGLTLFGFGSRVGIELPGEAQGLLRPPGQWTSYSVTRIPFGQEISVTGLQMLRAFCMLANGGRLVRPHVVKAMVTSEGEIRDMRPTVLPVGYIIKPSVAEWVVREALVSVVNDGTGSRAKLDKWQVFGKTGTAQLAKPDGRGYEHRAYVASFIAGAPAEDPRVVVLVSVRRPNVSLGKGYTGGRVASPVAATILEKTLAYLQVPPRDSTSSQWTEYHDPDYDLSW